MPTLINIDGFPNDFDDGITAFDIIDELGEALDFVENSTQIRWKAYFTQQAYDLVKADPDGYFYTQDGVEYVKVFENEVIPFIVDMRVAGIDDTILEKMPYSLGCRREMDGEQNTPDLPEEAAQAFMRQQPHRLLDPE